MTINSGSSTKTCYKDCKDTCSGVFPYTSEPNCNSIKGNDWYAATKSGSCWGCILKTCAAYFGCSESAPTSCNLGQTLVQKTAPWGNEKCCGVCNENDPYDGVICGSGQHCMIEGTLRGQCCFHDVWGDVTISSNDTNLAAETCIQSGYDGYEWIEMNCPNETTIEYAVKCKRFN